MRKAINENQTVQIALVAGLLLVAALFLATGIFRGGGDSGSTEGSSAPIAGAPAIGTPTGTPPAAAETGATAPPPATTPPPQAAGALTAGRGLPEPVVKAYRSGQTVVLLVVRGGGIEDRSVRGAVEGLSGDSRLAVFITRASGIARYARITQGVGVSRVPALVVIRPKRLSGGVPEAEVSYGFRGVPSVEQAVRDAVYDGPKLPYHPR